MIKYLYVSSLISGYTLLCCIALAFCTLQSLYPVILIVPVCLYKYKTSKNGNILTAILPIVYFIISLSVLLYACYIIVGDWSFVDSTFNFMLVSEYRYRHLSDIYLILCDFLQT